MKRILSLFLALVFLLGTAACGTVQTATPVEGSLSATAAPADTEAPTVEPQDTASPEPSATPLPTPEPTPSLSASELWRAFDTDFVCYMLREDISTYNQLIKKPETLPVSGEDIVITLGSYDKSEFERYYRDMHAFLDRLDEIDREALSAAERYAYDAVRESIEMDIEGEEFYGYFEPLEAFSGIQADLPVVFWLYDIRNAQDAEMYLALLATVPEFMDSLLNYERYRAELGIFMPKENLDKVLEDVKTVLSMGEDCFLIQSFESAADALSDISEEKRAELKAKNRELIQTAFLGGYRQLHDGLEKLRPFCRPSVGIYELGDETYSRYYEYYLRLSCSDETTVQKTAELLCEYIEKDYQHSMNAYLDGGDYYEGVLSLGTAEENMAYLFGLSGKDLPTVPVPKITYYSVPEKVKNVFAPAAYLVAAFDDPSHVVIVLNSPETDVTLLRTLAHEGWYGHLYQYAAARSMCSSLSQQYLQAVAYSEAFSQLGEYFFVKNTEAFDAKSLAFELADEWMMNDMLAYCSVLVNGLGYTKTKLKSHLKEVYQYDSVTAETIYEICVELPFYYIPYVYGFARFRSIFEKLGYSDWKSFYEDCFAVGPTSFHLLEAACRERNGLPAETEEEPEPGLQTEEEIIEEDFEEAGTAA